MAAMRRREQPSEAKDKAVFRIMRFMPVTIPMTLRIETMMGSGALRGRRGGITMGGTVKAGGFGARLTHRRVERGTSLPLDETSSERIALLHNRSLPIRPSSIDWAEPHHLPDLWIQYFHGDGSPVAPRTRLGRCHQGPFELKPCLPVNLFVDAIVMRAEALDPPPPSGLAISGDIVIRSGVVARLTISQSDPSGVHPSQQETAVDVPVIPDDTAIKLPRRTLQSPLGRDSWIYLALLDGTGQITGGESLLGRAQPGIAEMRPKCVSTLKSVMEPTYPAQ